VSAATENRIENLLGSTTAERVVRQLRALLWDAVWIVVLFWLGNNAVAIWREALTYPTVTQIQKYPHEWQIDGKRLRAEYVHTTLPNYLGDKGCQVTGFDSGGGVVWTVHNAKTIMQTQ
jgi:hypothetical protein